MEYKEATYDKELKNFTKMKHLLKTGQISQFI